MLSSDLLSGGCLALAVIIVWVGSRYSPNPSQPLHSPPVKESVQTRPQPRYYPHPFDPLRNPWRVFYGGRPVPNPPLVFRPNGARIPIYRTGYNPGSSVPCRYRQTQRTTTRTLVEDWRKATLGLIALSESNLKSAEEHIKCGDESTAVQVARTAVENMARALIHCCGGKPDNDPGQEEVLRMHSRRFGAKTRTVFENAVDKIAYVLLGERAEQTLQIASEITFTFKRLILDNFAAELHAH